MVITDRHDAAAALAWLVSVGADEAIADEPVDRFRAPPQAQLSPPPSLPPQGGGIGKLDAVLPQSQKTLPLEGGGLGGGEIIQLHLALQQRLVELQATIPAELSSQITPLHTQLYARMTDRALALIPPPMPRTPRTPA